LAKAAASWRACQSGRSMKTMLRARVIGQMA